MNDEQRVKFEAFLIEHDSEIGHGRYHKYHPMYPDQYFDYNAHIAWLAWQAAQHVKPLEFVKTGDYDNSTPPVEHYSATTEFGIIELIVDGDVAVPLISTYDFMRDVVGYDLAGFFKRNSKSLRDEIDTVLKALLAPETN